MKEKLNAFTFGQLQDFATMLRVLADNGISNEAFLLWIVEEQYRIVQEQEQEQNAGNAVRREYEKHLPKCPECAIPLALQPADPETLSEGSQWTCPRCRFGQYDPRPVMKIEKDLWKKAVPREERRRQRKEMLNNTTYGPINGAGCGGCKEKNKAKPRRG